MKKLLLIILALSLGLKAESQDSIFKQEERAVEGALDMKYQKEFISIYRRITKIDTSQLQIRDIVNLAKRYSDTVVLSQDGVAANINQNFKFGSLSIQIKKTQILFVKISDALVGIEIWKRGWSTQFWMGDISQLGYKKDNLFFHFVFSDGEIGYLYPNKQRFAKKFIRRLKRAIR